MDVAYSMCQGGCMKKFLKEIGAEVLQNMKQSKTEKLYWVFVAIFIIIIGWKMDMLLLSIFVGFVVILGGAIIMRINKSAVLTVATLIFVIWTTYLQKESNIAQTFAIEAEYRPVLSVYMDSPGVGIGKDGGVYYGGPIILQNKGKIPASNIKTEYYITTDIDKSNAEDSDYFERTLGGRGKITFLGANETGVEYGIRSLSDKANYYYFEAVVSYEGISSDKKYWLKIIKLYKVDLSNYKLLSAYNYGRWDRNSDFSIRYLSTPKTVQNLINKHKNKLNKN